MNATAKRAKSIFMAMVGKVTAEQWSSYLDVACSGDDDLRRQVESLLEAHSGADSFLAQPAAAVVATIEAECAGTARRFCHRPLEHPATGRVKYISASDDAALEALEELCATEGILTALETAHAYAAAREWARENPGTRILIGNSGRGDKDMPTLTKYPVKVQTHAG